jgi:hypothetical protein
LRQATTGRSALCQLRWPFISHGNDCLDSNIESDGLN